MSTTIEIKLRKLTRFDKCDRCGVRAVVLVKTNSGELTFCGHHAQQNTMALLKAGYPMTNEIEEKENNAK